MSLKNINYPNIEGISTYHLSEIYKAKCQDLNITVHHEQEMKFFLFSEKIFRLRKFDMKEFSIGPHAARKISEILRNNFNFYSIILGKNSIGDEGIVPVAKALSRNLSIVHVDVSSNDITPEGAKLFFNILSNHSSLISIDASSHEGLNRNRISVIGSKAISRMLKTNKLLTYLNLASTSLGPLGLMTIIEGLKYNCTLMVLNISNNGIGSKPIESLCKSLVSTNITDLYMSLNLITDEAIDAFANLLTGQYKGTSRLKILDISFNKLTARGAGKLFYSLRNNSQLSTLNIESNPLGPRMNIFIRELIEKNGKLENLNMRNCSLEDEGIIGLSEPLSKNTMIKTLNLSKNYLGDEAAQSIAFGLRKNKSLITIDLSNNKIHKKGGIDIAESLHKNMTLQSLDLKENDLKDEAGRHLSEVSRLNQSLLNVSLDLNPVDFKYIKNVSQNVKINRSLYRSKRAIRIKRDIESIKISDKSIDQISHLIEKKKQEKNEIALNLENKKFLLLTAKEIELQMYNEIHKEYQDRVKNSSQLSEVLEIILREISSINVNIDKEVKLRKSVVEEADKDLHVLTNKSNAYLGNNIVADYKKKRQVAQNEIEILNDKLIKLEQSKKNAEGEFVKSKQRLRDIKVDINRWKALLTFTESGEFSQNNSRVNTQPIETNKSKSKSRVKKGIKLGISK